MPSSQLSVLSRHFSSIVLGGTFVGFRVHTIGSLEFSLGFMEIAPSTSFWHCLVQLKPESGVVVVRELGYWAMGNVRGGKCFYTV